jgi:hypothetical protein
MSARCRAKRCKEALNKYLTTCQGIDVEIVRVMSDTANGGSASSAASVTVSTAVKEN